MRHDEWITAGLLIDIDLDTMHLDPGDDSDRLADSRLTDVNIQRRDTKAPSVRTRPVRLELR
jgi:hypothetical protein